MTRFLARRLLNYVVLLALASFLTFTLTSLDVRAAGQPAAAQPAAAAVRHRRQGRRTRPRQADPVRYAHWASGAVRGDFGTTVTGQPVADELWRRIGVSLRLVVIGSVLGTVIGVVVGAWGAIRQYRLSDRRHHRAVAADAQHADVRHRQPADPRRAASQLDSRRPAVRVHRRDVAGRRRRRVEPVRRPAAASGAADVHAGAGRDRRVTAATSATRCSTCSARTSSAPRAPRA